MVGYQANTRSPGGEILKYTEYQLGAANATVQGTSSGTEQVAIDGEGQPEQPADLSLGVDEPLAQVSLGEHPARIPRPYETPLDPRKRQFCPLRTRVAAVKFETVNTN